LLTKEPDATARGYLENSMFASLAKQLILHAEIKTKNDNLRKMRDEIIARGGEARKTMISIITGKVLADRTEDSRQRLLQWKKTEKKDPNDPQSPLTAENMQHAHELQDWLVVFEIAIVKKLKHENLKKLKHENLKKLKHENLKKLKHENLKKLKHESGSLEKWCMKLEAQLEVSDALGYKVTDHSKRLYLMENLITKMFEQHFCYGRDFDKTIFSNIIC
jgi:hypothetical protein